MNLYLPIIVLVFVAGCTHQEPVNQTQNLPEVPEIRSTHGMIRLTLRAGIDSQNRPHFYWNNRTQAPLLRVNPGDHIYLHLMNTLPRICGLGMISNVNIHFHGFNSSPTSRGDNILTRQASPSGTLDYEVVVNPGQPPGLYWYHAHAHGLTTWEVGNGMYGPIIVNGIARYAPEVQGLREHVIILGEKPRDPSVPVVTKDLAELPVDVHPTADRYGHIPRYVKKIDSDEGSPCAPSNDGQVTINDVRVARIGIRPNERELMRVVNVSAHRHFDLETGSPMQIIGQDGVPIAEYPGARALVQSHWVLPPGGRVEFVLQGSHQPMRLNSRCYFAGIAGDANPPVHFADFYDDSHEPQANSQRVEPVPVRSVPSFYQVRLPRPVVQRTIHLQEDHHAFTINGKAYVPAVPPVFSAHAGTVEEWTVVNNTDENHVFHLHQVHVVLESLNGFANPTPHWIDVVDIPSQGRGASVGDVTPSRVKLLVDFRDPTVRGDFVFHCHILEHEDGGMMAVIRVQ